VLRLEHDGITDPLCDTHRTPGAVDVGELLLLCRHWQATLAKHLMNMPSINQQLMPFLRYRCRSRTSDAFTMYSQTELHQASSLERYLAILSDEGPAIETAHGDLTLRRRRQDCSFGRCWLTRCRKAAQLLELAAEIVDPLRQ
jgi:hypothetical protein